MEILIRKAKKDYICGKCGKIIRKDEEYLDKVLFSSGGTPIGHERYHDECPECQELKCFKKIAESDEGLMAVKGDGDKVRIDGMVREDGTWKAMVRSWDGKESEWVDFSTVSKWIDSDGKSIVD